VIVTYNRAYSLQRLLRSISRANFAGHTDVPLIISIDKSNCQEVLEVARKFQWEHGPKCVIEHTEHLGLRKHIISCGDLTEEYGAVIVLEDDLYVSPVFYDYAVQAMRFYDGDERISGISLYSYDFNEYAQMRFCPLDDGYDNYFIQNASSWGQLWTRAQWVDFKQWYISQSQLTVRQEDPLPTSVIRWSESSWKKYFIKYMVLRNKYFVYPRVSLSTNFGDIGTHARVGSTRCQVPLALRRKVYDFSRLEDSISVYDSYFEIAAHCLKYYNQDLVHVDFESDFYGTKDLGKVKTEYLLSIRECTQPILSYSIDFVPQELSVILSCEGKFFHLAKVGDFGELKQDKRHFQLRHLHKNLGLRSYGFLFLMGLSERVGDNFRSKKVVSK